MTVTPPNLPQQTKIQLLTIIENFKNLRPVAIGVVILASSLFLVEKYNDIVQFHESVCRNNPSSRWCPSETIEPEWIGTKIEDVYIKRLQNYEPETTLVVTDKSRHEEEKKDISVLRNVDQDLSKLSSGGKKRNSGQFEAILRTAKNNRTPLCLRIYGKRDFGTSEFKNIIAIDEEFPESKNYDSLTSTERDQKCQNKRKTTLPASGNSN